MNAKLISLIIFLCFFSLSSFSEKSDEDTEPQSTEATTPVSEPAPSVKALKKTEAIKAGTIVNLSPGQTTQVGGVTVSCGAPLQIQENKGFFQNNKPNICSGLNAKTAAGRACHGIPEGGACMNGGNVGHCYGCQCQ